jgi:hypothetical protein
MTFYLKLKCALGKKKEKKEKKKEGKFEKIHGIFLASVFLKSNCGMRQ